MPKRAVVKCLPLQTCLVNLPLSIYGQLVSKTITPQSLVVCLSFRKAGSKDGIDSKDQQRVYVGWSGMPSRVVGSIADIGRNAEAVEMDPTCAKELGLDEGIEVSSQSGLPLNNTLDTA